MKLVGWLRYFLNFCIVELPFYEEFFFLPDYNFNWMCGQNFFLRHAVPILGNRVHCTQIQNKVVFGSGTVGQRAIAFNAKHRKPWHANAQAHCLQLKEG